MTKKLLLKIIIISIVVLVLAGSGYAGWKYWENQNNDFRKRINEPAREIEQVNNKDGSSDLLQTQVTNWKTYQNTEYGFELRYPENWFLSVKKAPGEYGIFIRPSENESQREGFFVIPEGFDWGWGGNDTKESQTIVDGEQAIMWETFNPDTKMKQWVLIKFENKGGLRIELFPSTMASLIVLQEILNTFKFR